MINMTGDEFSEKWKRKLQAATEDIRRGVAAVTEAPGKKAALKKNKWIAKMTDPKTADKWAERTGSVALEEWKKDMDEKGIGRIPAGTERATEKMAAFGNKLLSYQKANLGKIYAMPDLTLADSERRMVEWMKIMSNFRP